MALIVEDGTIVANADTYVSEAEYVDYALARGVIVINAAQELIKAIDYLETLNYIGQQKTQAQSLKFPRSDIILDGFEIADNEIPRRLVVAQMMLAMEILKGNDPMATLGRKVKSEKLDSMQKTYDDNSRDRKKIVSVDAYLSGLIEYSGTVNLGTYR